VNSVWCVVLESTTVRTCTSNWGDAEGRVAAAVLYWELPEIHTLCHDIKCDRHTVVAVAYKERLLLKCVCVST
jgi:hypothetical protein